MAFFMPPNPKAPSASASGTPTPHTTQEAAKKAAAAAEESAEAKATRLCLQYTAGARVWHNRRVELDLQSLVEGPVPNATASLAGGPPIVAPIPTKNDLIAHCCNERFVLSLATAPLPAHLRFLAALRWVQTLQHNVMTLTPSYTAVDPRDGLRYTLYDHVVLLEGDAAHGDRDSSGLPAPPKCTDSVWFLARDGDDAVGGGVVSTLRAANPPTLMEASEASYARSHTTSCHMEVLLVGYKFDGGRLACQDMAPRCPLCPWACPCLVDQWYEERSGAPLSTDVRVTHECSRIDDLLHLATAAALDESEEAEAGDTQNGLPPLVVPGVADSLPPNTTAVIPVTRSLMRCPARRVHLHTHANGATRALLSPLDAGDTPATMSFVLLVATPAGNGLADVEPAILPIGEVPPSTHSSYMLLRNARFTAINMFQNMLRVTLNDQLLRLLIHPSFEGFEAYFRLPTTFVADLFDPTRRPGVVPFLLQRAALPFPDYLTHGQRRELLAATERNWTFLRAGRRPPCILLLTPTQLARCAPRMLLLPSSHASSSHRLLSGAAARPRLLPTYLHVSISGAPTPSPAAATAAAASSPPVVVEVDASSMAASSSSHHHHRTKAQRKAAQRKRCLSEQADDAARREKAALVEALHRSLIEAEEAAIAEHRERTKTLDALAAAAHLQDALRKYSVTLRALKADDEDGVDQPLKAFIHQTAAVLLRDDAALWAPLLRQGEEFPDDERAPIDAACGVCLEVFDLVQRFPLQSDDARCVARSNAFLCAPCGQSMRSHLATALLRRAERKRTQKDTHRQRRAAAAAANNNDGGGGSGTDDDDALARRFPPPHCICPAQHPFDPAAWRLATDWVGRRWAAAHFGYTGPSASAAAAELKA